MHLHTILAFAFLFWRADQASLRPLVSADDVAVTLGVALGLPVIIWAAAAWMARRTVRAMDRTEGDPERAQQIHHWAVFVLRLVVVAGFGGAVFLTRWADWFDWGATHWSLQIVGDLIVLLPYFAAVTALWVGSYPLEARLRRMVRRDAGEGRSTPWSLGAYLDFNLRHQVFIVAAPMSLILFASNVVKANAGWLKARTGVFWAPDVALGLVAGVVFLIAPVMLRRIWRTHSLEPGPMRDRLEAICRRIGLRVRDILVWKSDGMVVNAAVMGIVPQMRYVMLSDGLLATMRPQQVEAVFGHEAGHVIHRHIQHFLLFAYVGWVLAAGAMELMLKMSASGGGNGYAIQGVGLGIIIVLWGLGFGWVSRRFERQADVYGASCVQPDGDECLLPCSVHLGPGEVLDEKDRVCATGAAVFGGALDRVAVLNGIPHEERSWRHSSIASRIRFLNAQAGDPNLAKRFARLVRRVKRGLLASAIVLSLAASYYWVYAEPALARGGR